MTCKHGCDCAAEMHDDMLRYASNLERYPFESATMAEAAKFAAGVLRNIADDFAEQTPAEIRSAGA